jgi:hypothetical protein
MMLGAEPRVRSRNNSTDGPAGARQLQFPCWAALGSYANQVNLFRMLR